MIPIEPTSETTALVDWYTASASLYAAIKESFLADVDSWSFDIGSPDQEPADADPAELTDLRGAAAFMLRRIQALRYLISNRPDDEHSLQLMTGYSIDLGFFLSNISIGSEGFNISAENLQEFRRGHTLTRLVSARNILLIAHAEEDKEQT